MIVGAIGFAVVTIIDYRAMVRLAWIGLGIAIALLLVARLLGRAATPTPRRRRIAGSTSAAWGSGRPSSSS